MKFLHGFPVAALWLLLTSTVARAQSAFNGQTFVLSPAIVTTYAGGLIDPTPASVVTTAIATSSVTSSSSHALASDLTSLTSTSFPTSFSSVYNSAAASSVDNTVVNSGGVRTVIEWVIKTTTSCPFEVSSASVSQPSNSTACATEYNNVDTTIVCTTVIKGINTTEVLTTEIVKTNCNNETITFTVTASKATQTVTVASTVTATLTTGVNNGNHKKPSVFVGLGAAVLML